MEDFHRGYVYIAWMLRAKRLKTDEEINLKVNPGSSEHQELHNLIGKRTKAERSTMIFALACREVCPYKQNMFWIEIDIC